MTIGSKFLDRVLAEGKKEKASSKFDSATETLKRALREIGGEKNFADKIVEVANLSGVPGRFMNTPEAKESIVNAAMSLRSKSAAVAAFLALHTALVGGVAEAAAPAAASEDDLEGVGFQQLVEEVLVALGIPADLVGKDASGIVKSKVRSAARAMMANAAVKEAYKFFAKKLGIKINDGVVGAKKPGMKKLGEATTQGTQPTQGTDADDEDQADPTIFDAAKKVISLLGVNLDDQKLVRVVNKAALTASMRVALRDAKVKRAMTTFLRTIER